MTNALTPAEIDEALDSVFAGPRIRHGLALYPAARRHSLPLSNSNGKLYLTCLATGRTRLARPEEVIRQLEIGRLRDELGYDPAQMAVGVRVKLGSTFASKPADIVLYTNPAKAVPHIIVECTKPDRLDGLGQLHSYMSATGTYLGEWVNGTTRASQLRTNPGIFESVRRLPAANETADDVRSPITKAQLIPLRDLKDELRYLENTVLANAGVAPFDELFKLIFTKLYDEAGKGYHDAVEFRTTASPPTEQYHRINRLFRLACRQWPGIFAETERIELTPQALVAVASELQDKRFLGADLDVLDAAFEYLINPEQKGDKGQYFTPRPVVKMCLRILNPRSTEKVLDPACGPAGFLIQSLNYVAERELAPRFGSSLDQSRASYAAAKLFGIDLDPRLVRVARAMMLIAGDGRSNIYRASSLDPGEWKGRADGLAGAVKDGDFDLVMTNPPFAGTIKAPEVLAGYDLAYKGDPGRFRRSNTMSRDALFVERSLRFLKPGGRMAIVLPQGNLNNVTAEYLRGWLRGKARILAVVGLSDNTFKRFTSTKTSVLFAQKWRQRSEVRADYQVFMAVNRKPVKDSSGRYLYRRRPDGSVAPDAGGNKIIDHDLDAIADAFIEFAVSEGLEFWK